MPYAASVTCSLVHCRLQSHYSIASADTFVLTRNILSHLNDHLRRHNESQMSSSDLGILIKSAFEDAVERKRHRLPQTGSAEETRVYAYFGLKALNEIRFEPPSKVV